MDFSYQLTGMSLINIDILYSMKASSGTTPVAGQFLIQRVTVAKVQSIFQSDFYLKDFH